MTRMRHVQVAVLFLPVLLFHAAALHADEWKLRKNSKGIQIFTREVPGSSSLEFRATTEVDSSMAGVLKLMEDIDSYPEWLPNLKHVHLVKILNSQEVLIYQRVKAPFPARDRDSFFKVTALRDHAAHAAILRITSMWDYGPEIKNVIRVKNVSGMWMFTPARNGDSMTITYQMHTEPGGTIPAWMANASVVKRPFMVLTKMREMLKNPRYREAKTSELRLFSPLTVFNAP